MEVRNPRPKLQSLLSQDRESYVLQIWPIYLWGTSEQKPIKNFGEKGAWAYPGTAQILGGTPYCRRNGQSYTNFKFYTHIHGLNRNKGPLKSLRKVAVDVVRDSKIFFTVPIYMYRTHRAVIFAVAQLSC